MDKSFKVVLIALIFSAMIFNGCKKKNKAPDSPSILAGPTKGSIDTKYTFASSAEDPDNDSVAIRFIWGEEDTSIWSSFVPSGDSISKSHSWSNSGTYSIRAQAQDLNEVVSSWSSGHQIIIGNPKPPNTPTTPAGPSIGMVNVLYSFSSTATDPDSDSIAIRFIWEDGDTSGWSDWQASEDSVSMSHSWTDAGNYNIKAQAKGKKDTTSDWSAGHPIDISSGWIMTFGGLNYDFGWSVQPTEDGGYIITGYTQSYGAGSADVYLIKTDENGNETWYKTFGGSDWDVGNSVQQTTDGGYIIAGFTRSYGAGESDVYLIKTDANGNETWYKTFGASASERGLSVQQTLDGGYIITGDTRSYGAGQEDVYLIKTDANGDTSWTKTFGDSSVDVGYSVQQTLDRGYIITGSTRSYGKYVQVYLIKTDANGDTSWTKTFGDLEADVGYSVQQTLDRGYIITGSTASYGAGGKDVYLIKTYENGEYIWSSIFGGSADDVGYSVQQTTDGGYIITGSTLSYGAGLNDVYLIKTNSSGDTIWTKTIGGSSNDAGYSIRRHYDSYIITGYTQSYGAGEVDVYLIKTDENGNVK